MATFKVVVLGAARVGKTAITRQFLSKTFAKHYPVSFLFDFGHRDTHLPVETDANDAEDNLVNVKVNVWDVTSDKRAVAMAPSYVMHADAVLVVYDCHNRSTFDKVQDFVDLTREERSDIPVLLVANKVDLPGQPEVLHTEGENFAAEHGLIFVPCTATKQRPTFEVFKVAWQHADQTPKTAAVAPKESAVVSFAPRLEDATWCCSLS